MSGAPIICSNHGAFPENVLHGITGYRCQTMAEFCHAAICIDNISPKSCRQWAMNFRLEAVAPQYTQYFKQVMGINRGKDWSYPGIDMSNLGVRCRDYPDRYDTGGTGADPIRDEALKIDNWTALLKSQTIEK
jgi:hypothetical protein